MGKDKKQFDEKLQELRHKEKDGVRYRKRIQEEQEAEKQLKEYERKTNLDNS